MSNHNFNQSQMLEQESTSIHDQNYIDYVGETNAYFETEFLLTIDRSSCDYQTEQGKAYQTADTDTIITMHCPKTKHTVAKKISEKTRGSFFNDMYIEVVSVMTLNNVTQKYEISSPGWGIKNEEMGPDFLSMVFMDKKEITQEQSEVLYYFLISYACKIANTTSVFGAFLKSPAKHKPFNTEFVEKIIKDLEEIFLLQNKATFYLGDILNGLKKAPKQTVIYLDPPYSTRRYESNYHILNYIADSKFSNQEIKTGSKTGQPKEMGSNPFGKKKETEGIFAQMILEGAAKSEVLGISYNTDGLIKQEWMEKFCKDNNLLLDTRKMTYKRFKSKVEVTNETELEEILWLIKKQ